MWAKRLEVRVALEGVFYFFHVKRCSLSGHRKEKEPQDTVIHVHVVPRPSESSLSSTLSDSGFNVGAGDGRRCWNDVVFCCHRVFHSIGKAVSTGGHLLYSRTVEIRLIASAKGLLGLVRTAMME